MRNNVEVPEMRTMDYDHVSCELCDPELTLEMKALIRVMARLMTPKVR